MKTVLKDQFKILIAALGGYLILQLYYEVSVAGDLSLSAHLSTLYAGLVFFLCMSSVSLLPGTFLAFVSRVAGQAVSYTIIIAFLLIHFMLIQYLMETGIPLGADLFGYSLNDISLTISASSAVDFWGVVIPILTIGVVIGLALFLKRQQVLIGRFWLITVPLLMVFAWVAPLPSASSYSSEAAFLKVQNPSHFFWSKTYELALAGQKTYEQSSEYPFLRPIDLANPMAQWLNTPSTPPNIVFVAVEGLGGDFVGPNAIYGGAMPYLDSLIDHSLYWEHAMSNTGRTFGILPSLTASLPYGQTGFMSMGPNMPAHFSLWSWLKANGYHTSFFYGGNANFDGQDVFLERQGVDYIMDEGKFPDSYQKMPGNAEGFTWGYGDEEVFKYSLRKIEDFAAPRMSFYMTLTTHEPFIPPTDQHQDQIQQLINAKSSGVYNEYRNIFECLAYTDAALKTLLNGYQKRPDYQNTLFIITGDHRLIPIPARNRINRFHVPLLIYSPLVKEPLRFQSLAVHSQITPTMVNWLNQTLKIPTGNQVTFISGPLSTNQDFGSTLEVPLMRNKNETEEYISGLNLLSNGELYTIGPNFSIERNDNTALKASMKDKLEGFKGQSIYALANNKLLPDTLTGQATTNRYVLPPGTMKYLSENDLLNRMPDTLYMAARDLALSQQYPESRVVIEYALSLSPNYHDFRVLMARTYGWNGQYDSSVYHLEETLRRNENYEDAFVAYSDVAYWNDRLELSEHMAYTGLVKNPESHELKARVARSYLEKNKTQEASKLVNEVLAVDPQNEVANTLKQRLKNQSQ